MYIEKINGPADVKRLSAGELETLSEEVRGVLLKKLSEHGGHVGPNLGMVEATVALHYVFNSPADKIVYDVSHQSYAHKILTGRKAAFMDAAAYDEVSGYTEPSESEHDFFVIGHTSTSVSLATGLAKARDLKGGTGNVIAVIGDGSLSGGEAFEGLNNAAELGTNFIVIVNDNQMSIAENHGGLYRNLQLLRETDGQAPCNFFTAMGLDYLYVKDGNNVQALIDAFRKVKDIAHPVAVHINTLKGKGYRLAEQQQERFHYSAPFCLETGSPAVDSGNEEDYGDLTARYLLQEMKKDRTVVGITAGTPTVFGFTPERREEAGASVCRCGHCRGARRCHGVCHCRRWRETGIRGVQHFHSARLRPVVAGPLYQQQSRIDSRLLGRRFDNERCHSPLPVRYSGHRQHSEHGLSGSYLP